MEKPKPELRMSALASAVQFLGGLAFGRMTDQRGDFFFFWGGWVDRIGCDIELFLMFRSLNEASNDV